MISTKMKTTIILNIIPMIKMIIIHHMMMATIKMLDSLVKEEEVGVHWLRNKRN